MNKYLLFLGDDYYPSGGWDDFVGSFDSLHEAVERIKSEDSHYKWAHIVFDEKIIITANGKMINFRESKWIMEEV